MSFFWGHGSDLSVISLWAKIFALKSNHQPFFPAKIAWTEMQRHLAKNSVMISDRSIEKLVDITKNPNLFMEAELFDTISQYLTDENGYFNAGILRYPATEPLYIEIPKNFGDKSALFRRWYDEAISLIANSSPRLFNLFSALVIGVIPINHYLNGLPHRRGFTSLAIPRVIFTTFEDRSDNVAALDLAIDLAHELGHIMLDCFIFSDKLLVNQEELIFSPVRKSLRPALQSFHALAALCNMVEVSINLSRLENLSTSQLNYINDRKYQLFKDFKSGLLLFESCAQPTLLGEEIMMEMHEAQNYFEPILEGNNG